jgi:hypothetical protein
MRQGEGTTKTHQAGNNDPAEYSTGSKLKVSG